MSVYSGEEQIVYEATVDLKKDILSDLSSRINKGGEPPTATMEAEKRIRREIANSNERRRMQSINNGFQSLRSLLPHHEGEKLSKAAILQQTAEYIYNLEQEKTRLLSQNCQLKRLINQHEGGDLPPKKRKTECILPKISVESSDEGVGSMSPEPLSLITVTVNNTNTTNGVAPTAPATPSTTECSGEVRRQLERERNMRMILEEQVQQLESQLYQIQQHTSQQQQVCSEMDMLRIDKVYHVEEGEEIALQLVTADNIPAVGHTQTIVCSSPPRSRTASPEPTSEQQPQAQQRLPSILEAAIKAEPKVEVERLPSPMTHASGDDSATPGRLYVSNTSRQNLETIVEAIRHLEGDHMFNDESQNQEVPLALTTKPSPDDDEESSQHDHHFLQKEMNTFLDFRKSAIQQQQSRPGVIVVKQAS